MLHVLIIIACLLSLPAAAQEASSAATRRYASALKKFRVDFEKQQSKLQKTFHANEREARQDLIKSLTEAMESAAKKVNLNRDPMNDLPNHVGIVQRNHRN